MKKSYRKLIEAIYKPNITLEELDKLFMELGKRKRKVIREKQGRQVNIEFWPEPRQFKFREVKNGFNRA